MDLSLLPGGDLVVRGLADLERGVLSTEALLVSIGAPRLRRSGLAVAPPLADPEKTLYALLSAAGAVEAHSRYNALVRRLVAFERALACAAQQTRSASTACSAPSARSPGRRRAST